MKTKGLVIFLYLAIPIIGIALLSHTHASQALGHTNLKQHAISQKTFNYSMIKQINQQHSTIPSLNLLQHINGITQLKPQHTKHALLKEQTGTHFLTQQEITDNKSYKAHNTLQNSTRIQNNTFHNMKERPINSEKTYYAQNIQFAPPTGKDLHNIPNPNLPMPLNHSMLYLSFFLILYSIKSYKKHN